MELSSAFITVVPAFQQDRLFKCVWLSVLTEKNPSNSSSSQGCAPCPLIVSIYTNTCTSSHESVKILKCVDDTTLIGLLSDSDEPAYRREINRLEFWCSQTGAQCFKKSARPPSQEKNSPSIEPPVWCWISSAPPPYCRVIINSCRRKRGATQCADSPGKPRRRSCVENCLSIKLFLNA